MKVLVTGGNGFIGKHIVDQLTKQNIEVVSYDLVPPSLKLEGVQYITGTVMDEFQLSRSVKGCDAVFHLAALLGVKRADIQLLNCMNINIGGTLSVLKACVLNNVPHVLATSSSEIFGDIAKEKVSEYSQKNPKSGYAVSKLAMEYFLEGFHREYGLNYNIVRYFNIYGPGQVAEFVVPRFVKMVLNGKSPKIYGDGKQVRSFCHITDAAKATVDLFVKNMGVNDSVNIGNDREPVTIAELADKVVVTCGGTQSPEFLDFSESDRNSSREIYYRVPDISKIRQLINYEPTIDLEEGLHSLAYSKDIPDSWVEPL
ncbi:MAG: NAD-dependent epimerase/dehydratase family protein [Gammaproteobacteria bacterium]|nr:NAD-dependent epimerase/dehydratase family protein [Gammaproteobacteria bacterium]